MQRIFPLVMSSLRFIAILGLTRSIAENREKILAKQSGSTIFVCSLESEATPTYLSGYYEPDGYFWNKDNKDRSSRSYFESLVERRHTSFILSGKTYTMFEKLENWKNNVPCPIYTMFANPTNLPVASLFIGVIEFTKNIHFENLNLDVRWVCGMLAFAEQLGLNGNGLDVFLGALLMQGNSAEYWKGILTDPKMVGLSVTFPRLIEKMIKMILNEDKINFRIHNDQLIVDSDKKKDFLKYKCSYFNIKDNPEKYNYSFLSINGCEYNAIDKTNKDGRFSSVVINRPIIYEDDSAYANKANCKLMGLIGLLPNGRHVIPVASKKCTKSKMKEFFELANTRANVAGLTAVKESSEFWRKETALRRRPTMTQRIRNLFKGSSSARNARETPNYAEILLEGVEYKGIEYLDITFGTKSSKNDADSKDCHAGDGSRLDQYIDFARRKLGFVKRVKLCIKYNACYRAAEILDLFQDATIEALVIQAPPRDCLSSLEKAVVACKCENLVFIDPENALDLFIENVLEKMTHLESVGIMQGTLRDSVLNAILSSSIEQLSIVLSFNRNTEATTAEIIGSLIGMEKLTNIMIITDNAIFATGDGESKKDSAQIVKNLIEKATKEKYANYIMAIPNFNNKAQANSLSKRLYLKNLLKPESIFDKWISNKRSLQFM